MFYFNGILLVSLKNNMTLTQLTNGQRDSFRTYLSGRLSKQFQLITLIKLDLINLFINC